MVLFLTSDIKKLVNILIVKCEILDADGINSFNLKDSHS